MTLYKTNYQNQMPKARLTIDLNVINRSHPMLSKKVSLHEAAVQPENLSSHGCLLSTLLHIYRATHSSLRVALRPYMVMHVSQPTRAAKAGMLLLLAL